MKKQYTIEREGQMDFFDNYGIPYEDDASILVDNTDGVYNGCILEFKLNINNLNKVLFQAIKYCSRMRIKGESVPATILLIDLNDTTVYRYRTENYRDKVQAVYTGAASKDNEGFVADPYIEKIDYSNMAGSAVVKHLLKDSKRTTDMFMPIDIDENCIVGWATRYYKERPNASKGDFIGDDTGISVKITGEIREPRVFKGLINPYTGKSNEKFKYLMDCLNDRLRKKDLGAFYTPKSYCEKAAELVLMAVNKVPDENDYVILDRCAGTGNLEAALIGLYDKNGDELISHAVVSTYEYYEYKVLNERLGDKVREIIPPTEGDVEYSNGCIANADAMSEEFINNPIIGRYINNPKCTIILFENPPYRDSSAANKTKDKNSKTSQNYVTNEMSKVKNNFSNRNISTVRELTNQFVWSGAQYYLRQKTDSYILFAPIKWWKSCGIVDLTFIKGYIFNRKLFHADGEGAVCCALWFNVPDPKTERIAVTAFKTEDTSTGSRVVIRKCKKTFTTYYKKRIKGIETNVFCNDDGTETVNKKCNGKSVYSDEVVGYVSPTGFTLDVKHKNLVRMTNYNNRGTYMLKSNYLTFCPLFTAKDYPCDEFYEKGETCIWFSTSDGGDAYTKDKDFLKSCLIYTCLSAQNNCLSFFGSDGRMYQNELCFDKNALATNDLSDMIKKMPLDNEEQALISLWNKILDEARATGKCNSNWNYGVHQIIKEINTSTTVGTGKNKKTVYDYPELNGDLDTLKTKLKAYYKSHITEKMFKYELLK